ncbi:hypothetical protein NC653_015783 [Populus alba x Populus x berolinensis]|uniref:Uncharacterized protein n=1 Tax=Populus alba x Populus x berolinensis TaxID=444605 RepID=A0AAD6QLA1_9ROSI|nr:hypothetical protein NC653_015783 [Populus alba x Populus x berolinensis]
MVLLPPIWNRRNYMGIRGYKRGRFQNNIEKSNAVKLSLSSIKSCFVLIYINSFFGSIFLELTGEIKAVDVSLKYSVFAANNGCKNTAARLN